MLLLLVYILILRGKIQEALQTLLKPKMFALDPNVDCPNTVRQPCLSKTHHCVCTVVSYFLQGVLSWNGFSSELWNSCANKFNQVYNSVYLW